jgi:hypothetical protein
MILEMRNEVWNMHIEIFGEGMSRWPRENVLKIFSNK